MYVFFMCEDNRDMDIQIYSLHFKTDSFDHTIDYTETLGRIF